MQILMIAEELPEPSASMWRSAVFNRGVLAQAEYVVRQVGCSDAQAMHSSARLANVSGPDDELDRAGEDDQLLEGFSGEEPRLKAQVRVICMCFSR